MASSLEQFVKYLDEEMCDVRKGQFAKSWLFDYYRKPENEQLKKLIEQENEVVYQPKVLQCKNCLTNSRNFYMKQCQSCSCSNTPKYIHHPKQPPRFPTKKDSFSILPYEFLFVVVRQTGGAAIDSEHRYRAEGVYHQFMKRKNLINIEYRQKFVAQFEAHADARCAISEMTTPCAGSNQQPMCYLLDNMCAKYYPGARLTILMIHPGNFTCSPFHFAHFIIQAQKMGIPSSAICFYCYGYKVQKKAGFGLVTLPCETFFSADEFMASIFCNNGEIIPFAHSPQVPTVDGFISAMTFESQSRAGNKDFPAPKGGRSVPWAEVDLNSNLFDD